MDIILGEVARPDACASLPKSQVDADLDLSSAHSFGSSSFVISGCPRPMLGHHMFPEGDTEPVAIGRLTGLANGHHDTTPVRIASTYRGLDER